MKKNKTAKGGLGSVSQLLLLAMTLNLAGTVQASAADAPMPDENKIRSLESACIQNAGDTSALIESEKECFVAIADQNGFLNSTLKGAFSECLATYPMRVGDRRSCETKALWIAEKDYVAHNKPTTFTQYVLYGAGAAAAVTVAGAVTVITQLGKALKMPLIYIKDNGPSATNDSTQQKVLPAEAAPAGDSSVAAAKAAA